MGNSHDKFDQLQKFYEITSGAHYSLAELAALQSAFAEGGLEAVYALIAQQKGWSTEEPEDNTMRNGSSTNEKRTSIFDRSDRQERRKERRQKRQILRAKGGTPVSRGIDPIADLKSKQKTSVVGGGSASTMQIPTWAKYGAVALVGWLILRKKK